MLTPKPFIVVIGMNNRRAAARRTEESIANVGANDNQAPLEENQVPPLDEVAMGDQVSVVPQPMTNGEIKENFLNFFQSMTSQANAVTSQVQAMTTQLSREVEPRVPEHANTTDFRLRDFILISKPMFVGSRSHEDPQYFLDDVYKILFAMGVTSI